jgi:outer membrane receptor for ferrienterochelin and colicins
MTGEHIKILIDGIPVTGRLWDRLDLSQLPLLNVAQIEVIEGPMSVVYGSNALAGAINIITETQAKDPFKLEFTGYAEPGFTYNFNLFTSARFRNSAFHLHGGRNFFSGWSSDESSRFKTWKPKLQYVSGGSYRYATPKLVITYNTDFLHEELRDEGALTLENLYEKAIDAYHFTNRWNNRLSLNRKYASLNLDFQAGYSFYQKRKISYLNDLVLLKKTVSDNRELHDTTTFHMISARTFISGNAIDDIEYQVGLDVNDEIAKGKRTGGTRQMFDGAGFLNIIYKPAPLISIQPGLRVMYNSDFKTPLIYALTVKAEPGNFTMKASIAKGFRAPSLKQLYLKFIDTNHEIYGNEDLKPETAHNFSFLIKYNQVSDQVAFGAKAGFFYNTIDNAIQLAINRERSGFGKYFNLEGIRYITQGGDINGHL